MESLVAHELRHWSQHGEDGVLQRINQLLPPKYKTFVEIGAHFHEANCLKLHQHDKWTGVYFDDFHEFHPLGFYKAWITKDNVNTILDRFPFTTTLDILSIDIDGNDFYIWAALADRFLPQIAIVEMNPSVPYGEDLVAPYDQNFRWDGTNWFGCSAYAWWRIMQYRGYSLVYVEKSGVNMFFVRKERQPETIFEGVDDLEFLCARIEKIQYPDDTLHRPFFTSEEAMGFV